MRNPGCVGSLIFLGGCYLQAVLEDNPPPPPQTIYSGTLLFCFSKDGCFYLSWPENTRGAISLCLAQMVSWASSEFLCVSEALSKLWASGDLCQPSSRPSSRPSIWLAFVPCARLLWDQPASLLWDSAWAGQVLGAVGKGTCLAVCSNPQQTCKGQV